MSLCQSSSIKNNSNNYTHGVAGGDAMIIMMMMVIMMMMMMILLQVQRISYIYLHHQSVDDRHENFDDFYDAEVILYGVNTD